MRGIAEEASALNRIERRISLLMTPSALNRGNFCSNRLVVKVPSLYLRPSSLLMRIGSLSEQNPSCGPVVVTLPSLLAHCASLLLLLVRHIGCSMVRTPLVVATLAGASSQRRNKANWPSLWRRDELLAMTDLGFPMGQPACWLSMTLASLKISLLTHAG
jgi:hypothetical protein